MQIQALGLVYPTKIINILDLSPPQKSMCKSQRNGINDT